VQFHNQKKSKKYGTHLLECRAVFVHFLAVFGEVVGKQSRFRATRVSGPKIEEGRVSGGLNSASSISTLRPGKLDFCTVLGVFCRPKIGLDSDQAFVEFDFFSQNVPSPTEAWNFEWCAVASNNSPPPRAQNLIIKHQ